MAQIFRPELAYYCGNTYLHKSFDSILLPVNLLDLCGVFETPLSSSSLFAGGADQPQGKFGCVCVSLLPVVFPWNLTASARSSIVSCFLSCCSCLLFKQQLFSMVVCYISMDDSSGFA